MRTACDSARTLLLLPPFAEPAVPCTLAHLSDLHLGPMARPRAVDLMNKRITGYWNWLRHRSHVHDMAAMALLLDDLSAHAPDHVALTGDLVNIGLPAEFRAARDTVAKIGPPDRVSIVPGNHDIYVRGSLPAMLAIFAAEMRDDGASAAVRFPYLRRRKSMALIGVSSAVPTAPLLASGSVGNAQRKLLAEMLHATGTEGLTRVVMIHHPPHPGGARFGRALRDARALAAVFASAGAELVIHGHNHCASLARLPGPDGAAIPIVGVPSASAVPGTPAHRAAYHLFRFTPKPAGGHEIHLERRALAPSGSVIHAYGETLRESMPR